MRKHGFRLFSVLVLALMVICLSLTAACKSETSSTTTSKTTAASTSQPASSSAPASSAPVYGGKFTLILPMSPAGNIGWPPEFLGGDSTSAQILYEPLMTGLRDGSYIPRLAESWELAADKLSCTYHLRKGVKFHDGTDFNADAVKFNFDAVIKAKRQVYWDHVDVVDPYTVKIVFKEFRNGIQYSCSGNWIASPTAAQKNGSLDYIRLHPCGTGPFMFVSYQQDVNFIAKKNPDYWMKGKPYLDTFEFKYVPDVMTQKAAMQAGEADGMPTELGKKCKEFMDLGFNVLTQHQSIFSLYFDTNDPTSPFVNQKVREACEYAIDKKTIAKNLGFGLFKVPESIIAADNAAFMPDYVSRQYDPAKAKQLLAEAGYPNGFKTQLTPNNNGDRDINLAVKEYLDNVGIATTLNYLADPQFMEQRSGKFKGMILEPVAAFANFATTLSMYLDKNSIYFTNMNKPPEMQAYIDKIAHAEAFPDIPDIREFVKYIQANAFIIPVHDGGMGYALSKKVNGKAFLVLSFPPYFAAEEIWMSK